MNAFFIWLSANPLATNAFILTFSILIISISSIYLVAFFQGRAIYFWPPKIGERPSRSDVEEEGDGVVTDPNAQGPIGTELGDYSRAVDKTKELIDLSRGRHSLKLLAITGRSTMQFFLADLIKQYEGHLDIELQVVDPTSPHLNVMPKLWASEPATTVQEIIELWNARKYQGTLKVWKYKYLPCIGGEIINEEHLLITFFGWDDKTKKLGDFQEHYVYHARDSKTGRKAFELYESWFEHAPKENMFASEIDPAAGV